jgi:chemotaxis protein methyltransferase WspC
MSVDRIAALLTRKTGLDPAALGTDAVAQAVRRRMAGCGLSDCGRYEEKLLSSDEEWQSLVDEVVVKETWFFRDGATFDFLRRHLRERWLPAHAGRVLRALSVPCATGEEACSIAITLLQAGMAAQSFQIDAFDVSRTAIARCREATYGTSSFRGGRLELRGQYFTAVEGGYRPRSEVTAGITFRQGNLLEAGFAAGQGPYDIVFCRNLLIYFDLAARKLAGENLYRLLADDGVLFAGHTETTYTLGARFAPLEEPRAFAYRKVLALPQSEPAWQAALLSSRRAERRAAEPPSPSARPEPALPPKLAPVDDSPALLERASRLADEGALDAAAAICRQLVARQNPRADACCLLGLIEEALGDRGQAEGCYTRALFLDPDHYESLIHLILLVESRGDAPRAAALRARVGRTGELENRHAH